MIEERERLLTQAEYEILKVAIELAPVVEGVERFLNSIALLRVIGHCRCGCGSLSFRTNRESNGMRRFIIADAVGKTLNGGQLGVLVWGLEDAITALEIYDLGAGDEDQTLPVPLSLRPFPKTVQEQKIKKPYL